MPLSQFRPANFTGLPDSHQPAAWLVVAPASKPRDRVVASMVLLSFIESCSR